MHDADRHWLSIHVFLSDPVRTERYLRERLAPAIQAWRADGILDRWFFIRYWEGGPHLRIRLAGRIAADEARAMAVLSDGIALFAAENPPTPEDYYRNHSFDGRAVVVQDLPWFAEGTVTKIDYVPEILRYGGEHGIDANEELFDLSSRLALALCKATEGHRDARLSEAFALMAAAMLACGEDMAGVAAYFEQYGTLWASRVGDEVRDTLSQPPSEGQLRLLRRLEEESSGGWSAKSMHAAWGSGVRQLTAHLHALHEAGRLAMPFDGRATVGDEMRRTAILGIVGSQIHMLNNRLGIPPTGEFLLARLVADAANALQRQDATA